MGQLQKFKQDYILMVEAGFIAVNQTDEDSAVKLFNAASLLDPSNLLPKVGMGYIHLVKLELKQAVKVFEEVLAIDPNHETAKAFLAISLSLNPAEGAKGEKMLEEAAKNAQEPMVKNLAATALDFVTKFVKKAPSPAQVAPKTK